MDKNWTLDGQELDKSWIRDGHGLDKLDRNGPKWTENDKEGHKMDRNRQRDVQ